jgi:hypothetical protein
MREPLGTSGLKEGIVGGFGAKSPWKPSHGKESETGHRRHMHSPRKKKKWQYACSLFGTNSLKEGAV